MTKGTKRQINQALTRLKLVLRLNHCGIAADDSGHLFIFDANEFKEKGYSFENCDGIGVYLKDLVR